jgi:hypothetical protein
VAGAQGSNRLCFSSRIVRRWKIHARMHLVDPRQMFEPLAALGQKKLPEIDG